MWRLPEPGFLEGVKSKDKAILKMHNMDFQYPNTPKPQLTGVSLQVRLVLCSPVEWETGPRGVRRRGETGTLADANQGDTFTHAQALGAMILAVQQC